jgi:protein-S-isoprenylcysteine O-methyltransferase Ste14
MKFQATDFEFHNRFWMIGAIFGVAFFCYSVDKTNAANALAQHILSYGSHGSVVNPDSPQFNNAVRVLFAWGTLFLVLAALIRSWATAYLQSGVVHDAAIHSERLVADGPYRHVRNPLYLGNILMTLGIGLMASRIGFLVLVVGNLVFMIRLIRHEEAGLLQSQGESYRQYLQAVPQLWFSFHARVPGGDGQPNWSDGFLAELFFWSFAFGMVILTITLNANYFFLTMGAGFAIYFLQNYLRSRRKA